MLIYEPYKKVPLSDFVNELRFEFPNVPDDIFFHHIRKTANTAARQGSLILLTGKKYALSLASTKRIVVMAYVASHEAMYRRNRDACVRADGRWRGMTT